MIVLPEMFVSPQNQAKIPYVSGPLPKSKSESKKWTSLIIQLVISNVRAETKMAASLGESKVTPDIDSDGP